MMFVVIVLNHCTIPGVCALFIIGADVDIIGAYVDIIGADT